MLATCADFALGDLTIKPSLRLVEGASGSMKVEPRVMRVLVALADARGGVLSREALLRLCWDDRIVGEDAINRAVAEVRRILNKLSTCLGVETIPRVGFRLVGDALDIEAIDIANPVNVASPDRRKLVLAGVTGLAALAAGAMFARDRNRRAEVDALIENGRRLQATGTPDGLSKSEGLFRDAIALDPDRAAAWGWLAHVTDNSEQARGAAEEALARDPKEPNARTVLAFQRRDLDSWTRWEDALLAVLQDSPDCAAAWSHLTLFYQGMGRCTDSWEANERAIAIEPFNAGHQQRRALKHWIFGRIGESDKVVDQALRLWPKSSLVWNARMLIYAFTDRPSAGLALLGDAAARPPNMSKPSVESWRAALVAIGSRSIADIREAKEVCTRAATLAPGLAANAVMVFAHLGELDAAFAVADGLLQNSGLVMQRGHNIRDFYAGSEWGRTQFLFVPAMTSLRADPRFAVLCQRLGHVAYWRKRGIWPDSFVRGVLDPTKPA